MTYPSIALCPRFPAPAFFTPLLAFFGVGWRGVDAFVGVDLAEFFPLGTLKFELSPEDLAIARMRTRRSEMARGVGISWSLAVLCQC